MSKDSEPIRSRRALRETQGEQGSGTGTGKPPVPVQTMPKIPAASPEKTENTADDGDAGLPRERSSQTRARDRAALRAYKQLAEPAPVDPLPSRRALRQAQLEADRAPVTSVNPVVPPTVVPPTVVPPTAAAPAAPAVQETPATQAATTRQGRRSAPGAPDQPGTGSHHSVSHANGQVPEAVPGPAMSVDEALAARTAQAQKSTVPTVAPATPSGDPYPDTAGLTPGGAYHAVSVMMPTVPVAAPSDEELKVLAEQRAQAERAAILNQRAQAREKLAQESAKSRNPASDPTAVNNLAMVTPLEFMQVPGLERPVLRPPGTSHIPVVASAHARQASAAARLKKRQAELAAGGSATGAQPVTPGKPGVAPSSAGKKDTTAAAEHFDAALAAGAARRPGPGTRPLTGGHGHTLKRAEALAQTGGLTVQRPAARTIAEAQAADGQEAAQKAAAAVIRQPKPAPARVEVMRSQMPPLPADYAHGLEPLDAVTAGLGRTQRNLLIQWGSIILGGAALVALIVLIITG